ncbi:GNAT family N-acetyltransferase [Oceanirhabdus sp. W0125-5]|uniref:GNAT family N-acetyltransferase n=1 Tax=Oceanirhabdus sp. W0125-5 TaxID=2999116 RepID=UPI0022F30440|nr:GNAT family N-acetyltransferase [Oceanirhabdus sp. W0125-5]WBW95632.1 GNAT family N-acetyltransferase [Oceanirhabdus sp. W0125-5]
MLRVIKAEIKDSDQIAKCTRRAYADEIKKYSNNQMENEYPLKEEVEEVISKYNYYKIILNEKIIGGVFLVQKNDKTVCIEDFCIDPEYQNKGYGTKVLIKLETMNKHIKTWTLVTPTYSIGNQYLYKKLGYKEVGIGKQDGIEVVKFKKEICAYGENISLEFAQLKDKKLIYDMLVSPEVKNLMFDENHPEPSWEEFDEEPDSLFSGVLNEEGNYLLIKVDGEVIGTVSYAFNSGKLKSAELDIWISSTRNLGKGYGTEAIKLVIEFVHSNYGIKTFIIRPWIKNNNAIKAYEKCGFKEIEVFDPSDFYSEEEVDEYGEGDYGVDETVNLIYEIE